MSLIRKDIGESKLILKINSNKMHKNSKKYHKKINKSKYIDKSIHIQIEDEIIQIIDLEIKDIIQKSIFCLNERNSEVEQIMLIINNKKYSDEIQIELVQNAIFSFNGKTKKLEQLIDDNLEKFFDTICQTTFLSLYFKEFLHYDYFRIKSRDIHDKVFQKYFLKYSKFYDELCYQEEEDIDDIREQHRASYDKKFIKRQFRGIRQSTLKNKLDYLHDHLKSSQIQRETPTRL
jgi:hypothetical protein